MNKAQLRQTAVMLSLGLAQFFLIWRRLPKASLAALLSLLLTMATLAYAFWLARYWNRDESNEARSEVTVRR